MQWKMQCKYLSFVFTEAITVNYDDIKTEVTPVVSQKPRYKSV